MSLGIRPLKKRYTLQRVVMLNVMAPTLDLTFFRKKNIFFQKVAFDPIVVTIHVITTHSKTASKITVSTMTLSIMTLNVMTHY